MKRDKNLRLLDVVLADDDWDSAAAKAHAAGMASLRARKRTRMKIVLGTQVLLAVFCAALFCGIVTRKSNRPWNVRMSSTASLPTPHPFPSPRGVAADCSKTQSGQSSQSPYVTEEQMLKMFPEGSCLVAEVNGEKQLIFLQEH